MRISVRSFLFSSLSFFLFRKKLSSRNIEKVQLVGHVQLKLKSGIKGQGHQCSRR
jgi:hypothetical protein